MLPAAGAHVWNVTHWHAGERGSTCLRARPPACLPAELIIITSQKCIHGIQVERAVGGGVRGPQPQRHGQGQGQGERRETPHVQDCNDNSTVKNVMSHQHFIWF